MIGAKEGSKNEYNLSQKKEKHVGYSNMVALVEQERVILDYRETIVGHIVGSKN